MLDVALLGTGGMMPLPNRYLTSLLCRLNGKMVLIDCGESTQTTIKLLGWGYKNIDIICLTHFHADHISGLPGLLLTMGNSDRTETVTVVGPVGIKKVVESLCIIAPELPFGFNFIELSQNIDKDFSLNLNDYKISFLPLEHRMPCFGYSIEYLRKGKFDVEKAKQLPIPIQKWSLLQNGENVIHNDVKYTPDMVMGENRRGLKVSYCTDTRPLNTIPEFIKDSNLFVCEGLYGDKEKIDKVKKYKHMLFHEAALLAKEGNVNEMWLTHFSPALTNPNSFVDEAKSIFSNTKIGKDRMVKKLSFD